MNSKTILFSLIAAFSFSQTYDLTIVEKSKKNHYNRAPASEAKSKNKAKKKVISKKEMDDLKKKLAKLEIDLKQKEAQLVSKSQELEKLTSAKEDERIQNLKQLLIEQKKQIADLSEQIKNTEISDVTIVQNSETINVNNEYNVSLCLAKAKQSKLEEEIKKLLKDKEDVLKEVQAIKEEKEEVKNKSVVEAESKDIEEKSQPRRYKSDSFELLSQITNLMMSNQQSQMQMQMQMFSMMNTMMSSMSANNFRSQEIYSDPYANIFASRNPYAEYFSNLSGYIPSPSYEFNTYPRLNRNYDLFDNNQIGLNSLERQPSSAASVYQESNVIPMARSYDFNFSQNYKPLQQPDLVQMERSLFQ